MENIASDLQKLKTELDLRKIVQTPKCASEPKLTRAYAEKARGDALFVELNRLKAILATLGLIRCGDGIGRDQTLNIDLLKS
jgi:hypothetical protein